MRRRRGLPRGLGPALLAALALALALAEPAMATAPGTFGHGARSAALALADVSGAEPTAAPQQNAAAAAAPGFRLRLGYGYSGVALTLDGEDAGVRDASGLDLGAQIGEAIRGHDVRIGLALAVHVPDQYLARVAFRPATEPQFIRYESSLQRTTIDVVGAVGWGPLSIGGGVAGSLDVAGAGTDFTLGQDARGTYADARTDIELPYRFAPLVGAELDLDRVSLGAAFRGALGVDLHVESRNRIALADNPLNGTTTVVVGGVSGYDPPLLDLGARATLARGLSAFAALELALYRFAPPPVAEVSLDVRLGTTPSQREARFVAPRLRDTLSARLGLELAWPDDAESWRWAVRAGYAVSPSPVPPQTGFTSYADATRHVGALGAGYRFGRVAGVDVALSVAGQAHLLETRLEEKASAALPHARYEAGGRMLHGSASLEGTWR